MGILNAIFAPFIVLYLLMYSFFRYFEVGFLVPALSPVISNLTTGISQRPIHDRGAPIHLLCRVEVQRVQRIASFFRKEAR